MQYLRPRCLLSVIFCQILSPGLGSHHPQGGTASIPTHLEMHDPLPPNKNRKGTHNCPTSTAKHPNNHQGNKCLSLHNQRTRREDNVEHTNPPSPTTHP